MKTLLLLAGRSKRFWPLQEKSLFPINGKTLLEHQVERLQKGGCKEIILVGGAHNVQEASALFPKFKTVIQKDLDMGMQGALLDALPHCGKNPVLIVSANDVIDPSAYKTLTAESKKKGVNGAILAKKVKTYFPGGYLSLKGKRVTGIVEKPGAGNEPSSLVTIVAHVHNDPSLLLQQLKNIKSTRDDGYEQALQKIFSEKNYAAVSYNGQWQAVKYPWHMLSLLPIFLDGIKKKSVSKKAKIHKTAVIEGNVIIEDDVKILAHATVVGPAFIGKGTIIGTGALVRGSSIGPRCIIGFNTEIKSSVLSNDVWTHMTYIGDSVIGENVSFGGGSVTGNLRLDEGEILTRMGDDMIKSGLTKFGTIVGSNTRLGIQVGINPGIKIGGGTFVAGGVYITEDIVDKSFILLKEGKVVRKENKVMVPSIAEREEFLRKITGKAR